MNDIAYTIAELAQRWNCSTKTVWRLIRNQRIHAFRVGKEWRIPATCVLSYEAQS